MFSLGSAAMLPLAKAADVHETKVTISGPVEVPRSRVLPAGQYVFKLAEESTNRNIVRIFNADQSQLVTTVVVVPTVRSEPSNDSVITFEERAAGSPEALGKCFAGQTEGVEFLYPR
jgi:hypothetical protein